MRGRAALSSLLLASALASASVPVCAAEATPTAVAAAARAEVEQLPRYQPRQLVAGPIRLWGHGSFKHDFMRKLVRAWERDFQRHHPDARIDYRMYGTASAVGALYTGVGDIALLGEEISPAAARAFLRAKGYPHTDITVATGSVDTPYFDYAHMIFVHRDNPLQQLSLAQLQAIFAERGAGQDARNWGEVGLGDDWAARRIQPYSWKTDVDFSLFFRERVLEGNHRWNPWTREYAHVRRADGSQYDQGAQILDALAQDRDGIAISNIRFANPQVRALPLAWRAGEPAVQASVETLMSQAYPLVRVIPAIVDRPPGQPLAPLTGEFLSYLLSREGQQALLEHSGYLPLGQHIARQQRAKLQ